MIAPGDGQIRPYRNAPVPWQEPAVPAKAGKDLSFIDPVSVSLNGSVLDIRCAQDDIKRRFPRFLIPVLYKHCAYSCVIPDLIRDLKVLQACEILARGPG